LIPGIETYSVEGTPCDSVILALGKLVTDKPDLVVSGINQGLNTGDDVLISGTVGAALQGYLRNIPAIAISVLSKNNNNRENAARLIKLLADKFRDKSLFGDLFLNINIPDMAITDIKGIKVTRQAHKTHIDTVKEGHDGKREYYWLVRQQLDNDVNSDTDIHALNNGYISITPLNDTLFFRPSPGCNDNLCLKLFNEFIKN
jgi:5'-nucleotidase